MSASPAAPVRLSAIALRPRLSAVDNAKVLLVLLVVVGHFLTPTKGSSVPLADSLYLWIFLFHMPAFAFVMGHISRIAGPAVSSPQRRVRSGCPGPDRVRWIARATSLLPEPASPNTSTGSSCSAVGCDG